MSFETLDSFIQEHGIKSLGVDLPKTWDLNNTPETDEDFELSNITRITTQGRRVDINYRQDKKNLQVSFVFLTEEQALNFTNLLKNKATYHADVRHRGRELDARVRSEFGKSRINPVKRAMV